MDASPFISAGAGLLGVIVGGCITAYSQWRGRVNERHRDQLQNFYSPLLGLREQIRAKSELRTRLHSIAGGQYPDIARDATEAERDSYTSILDYSEKQLKEELVPAYEQMEKVFTDKMSLAEPSTRAHYKKLVDFVEIWKRFIVKPFPAAVVNEIGHTEAGLQPFYDDLEKHFTRLQTELATVPDSTRRVRKLNGWMRLGIIASAVWFVFGWVWTFSSVTDSASEAISSIHVTCDSNLAGKTGDAWKKGFEDCNKQAEESLLQANKEARMWAAIVALVPVPLGWGLTYLLIFIVRWVKRGFVG